MKTRLLPTLLLTLIATSSLALAGGKYSRYTADYYRGVYDVYEGKQITLKVAFIKPYLYKSDIPDARFFHAITRDDERKVPGGEIPIAVPIAGGEDLMAKYGTVPSEQRSQTLVGILRADGHGLWFVDVNGDITKKLDARRQTVMATPSPTPAPSASPEPTPEASAASADATPSPTPAEAKHRKHEKADGNGAEPDHHWWKIW